MSTLSLGPKGGGEEGRGRRHQQMTDNLVPGTFETLTTQQIPGQHKAQIAITRVQPNWLIQAVSVGRRKGLDGRRDEVPNCLRDTKGNEPAVLMHKGGHKSGE